MAEPLGEVFVRIGAKTADFHKKMEGVSKRIDAVSEASKTLAIASTAAFVTIGAAMRKAVNAASDYDETTNVIQASFGRLTPRVEKWAETTGQGVGRSTQQMREFAGTMQAMLGPMVGNVDAAAEMSTSVAELAVDMGSFFNVMDVEALTALRSALVGETEPMRRFGVVMTEASLGSFALSKGITKSVKNMSEAEKVALRYQFILEKTKLQQGDAARTAGSYANVMKALSAEYENIAVEIGKHVLPTIRELAANLRDGLRMISRLSPEIKSAAANLVLASAGITGGGAALFGLGVAIKPVKDGLLGLKTAFTALSKASLTAGASMLKALLPVTIIGSAILLLIGSMSLAWKELGADIKAVSDTIIKELKAIGTAAKEYLFDTPASFFDELVASAAEALGIGVEVDVDTTEVEEAAKKLKDVLVDTPGNAIDEAIDEADIPGSLSKSFSEGLEVIKPILTEMQDVLTAAIDEMFAQYTSPTKRHRSGVGGVTPEAAGGRRLNLAFILGPIDEAAKGFARAAEASERLAEQEEEVARRLAEQHKEEFRLLAVGEASKALGHFGETVEAAQKGFAAAGPIGAAGGALLQLATKTKGFKRVVKGVNEVFAKVVALLEPIFRSLGPALGKVLGVVGLLLQRLAPLFDLLAIMLRPVAAVLTVLAEGLVFVADVIKEFLSVVIDVWNIVATGLTDFLNAILDVWNALVQGLADFLRGIEIFGERPLAFLADALEELLVDRLEAPTIATFEQREAANEALEDFHESLLSTTDTFGTLADTADEVAESLSNVPTGFKVALARYRATEGEVLPDTVSGADETGAAPAGGVTLVVNGDVGVAANDPIDMIDQINSAIRMRNFLEGGTTVQRTSPYALPSRAGSRL